MSNGIVVIGAARSARRLRRRVSAGRHVLLADLRQTRSEMIERLALLVKAGRPHIYST